MRYYKSEFYGLRNLSAILPLWLMVAMALPISVANAQFVSSSRDPDVSSVNNFEYDLSDIIPGVLESARITGSVETGHVGSGVSIHVFDISAGDGMGGGCGDGLTCDFRNWHDFALDGSGYDYDIDISSAFRTVVLEHNTGLLLQQFYTFQQFGDDPGGVVSSPKLELTLRPTTEDTEVYYQTPVDAAQLLVSDTGSAFVDRNTFPNSLLVTDRLSSYYSSSYTDNYDTGAGAVEYDISSIPATAEILWAAIDVRVSGFSHHPALDSYPTFDIVGYHGDGIIAASDATSSVQWNGSTGQIRGIGSKSWAIDPEFVETILQSGGHLGLLLQEANESGRYAWIPLNDSNEAGRPHLAIGYTIPDVLKADVNLDGAISFLDIAPFIALLAAEGNQAEADCDCDGDVDFLDITPFINILSSQ